MENPSTIFLTIIGQILPQKDTLHRGNVVRTGSVTDISFLERLHLLRGILLAMKTDLEATGRTIEELGSLVQEHACFVIFRAPVEDGLVIGDITDGGGFTDVSICDIISEALVALGLEC